MPLGRFGKNMNLKQNKTLISIWLLPVKKESEVLARLIRKLSEKYNAQLFEPHMTIYAVELPDKAIFQIKQEIARIAKVLKPLKLAVSRINYEESFFKSFFLDLEKSDASLNLYQKFQQLLVDFGDYSFNPHLSLLYKNIGVNEKKKVAEEIGYPKQLTFDRLAINVHDKNLAVSDVESWKVEIL